MKIAIIGAGVAGMATAYFLQEEHEVTLFDRQDFFGGHVLTIPVEVGGNTLLVEIGPKYFFDASYPYFLALLRLLDMRLQWNDIRISFTDRAGRRTIVMPPGSMRRAWSVVREPRALANMLSLYRLSKAAVGVARRADWSITLRDYLAQRGYPPAFGQEFLYPFFAASWGAPLSDIPQFPAYSLLKGMRASPRKKAGFYEVEGGMSSYMGALGARLVRVRTRLGTTVSHLAWDGSFHVGGGNGSAERFDHIVVATSSGDAARLLAGLPAAARHADVVRRFRHFRADIVVHGDASLMPPRRGDWVAVNLFRDGHSTFMTDWSGLARGLPVFRTWLPERHPLPEPLYLRREFDHLMMSPDNGRLTRRIAALQGHNGIWLAGMYAVDVDNHESALLSAIAVGRALSPTSRQLRALLNGVATGAGHDLTILPEPAPAWS